VKEGPAPRGERRGVRDPGLVLAKGQETEVREPIRGPGVGALVRERSRESSPHEQPTGSRTVWAGSGVPTGIGEGARRVLRLSSSSGDTRRVRRLSPPISGRAQSGLTTLRCREPAAVDGSKAAIVPSVTHERYSTMKGYSS